MNRSGFSGSVADEALRLMPMPLFRARAQPAHPTPSGVFALRAWATTILRATVAARRHLHAEDQPRLVDCMVIVPDIGGRRRALRSWIGLVDRGHLGPAGVTVEHANGRLGSRPHTIRRADQAPMFI